MPNILLITFFLYSLLSFLISIHQTLKGRVYRNAPFFELTGAFVMGDAVVFGLFWVVICLVILSTREYKLFPFIYSLFWAVRGLTESIYWLNQQFSSLKKEPPEKYPHAKLFKGDAVWFVNQIFWQCITVLAVVASAYFGHLWLNG